LRNQINSLPGKSVIVMDNATELAKLEDPNFWNRLDREKFSFLHSSIKPLMRTISQADFKAMQFEKDVLEASLYKLRKETDKFEVVKESIIEKINQLPLSISIVEEQKDLIEKAMTGNYWADVSENDFDELTEKLSPLMKFIDSFTIPTGPEKLNLKDLIFAKEKVEFGPKHESVSISEYKKMVEEKILELSETNVILKKLKTGKEVSEQEIQELAGILFNEQPHITIELLMKVYNRRKANFIQFVRHILGLEVLESFNETVTKTFNGFIENHSYLSVRQLEFLDLLKKFIIEKGALQKKDLIQSPFTLLHPEGIRGVFNPKEIDEIVDLANKLVA